MYFGEPSEPHRAHCPYRPLRQHWALRPVPTGVLFLLSAFGRLRTTLDKY